MRIKTIVQALIYLIEVMIIAFLFTIFYSKLENGCYFCWTKNILTVNFLSNLTLFFVLYQILIYSFITLYFSAKNDANLAIRTIIDTALIDVEYGLKLDTVKERCIYFLEKRKGKFMFSKSDLDTLKAILDKIESFETGKISELELLVFFKILSVNLNHYKDYNNLVWKNSILLNLVK